MSICEKKFLAEVWLFHAEQMPLYNFIILRKKRDSNTGVFLWNLWNFQEQWWLLLKTRNIVLHNKKLRRAKISHLQCHPLTLLHLLLTQWWDMRPTAWCGIWLWEERAESRNVCLKWKVLLMPYYIDKNGYHFIKQYLE